MATAEGTTQADARASLPGPRLPRAVREFLDTEAAGGVVLLAAALVALAWANSPWKAGYLSLWETEITVAVGDTVRTLDLRHVVNEALMALFFFVVGLEIKRELVAGELHSPRKAALPALAALGGMVVPAALYAGINLGAPGAAGWGVPMATDIAFAVGVLALLGPRVPPSLKLFLLTLAIVDDIGAIVVIAVFYAGHVDMTALASGAAVLAAVVALRVSRIDWMPVYVVLGLVLWAAVFESGVHATIAGVVLGLLTPARPLAAAGVAREWARDLAHDPTPADLQAMSSIAKATVSVAEQLQHRLHPLVSYVVVPAFALANAGVVLDRAALDADGGTRVVIGVVAGLLVGKFVGIGMFTWLAVRLRIGALPEGLTMTHVAGGAALAGIGFTVALFVAGLAYEDAALEAAAKLGILAASALAGVGGFIMLRSAGPPSAAQGGER
jgi:NhaA family Na+:H+ antiporter